MNTKILKGDWDIAKGKLKKRYAKLTDNDLKYIEGHVDELVGRVEKATGERRDDIERFVREERIYGESGKDRTI